ncbi:MAG: hypothetical protein J5965_11175 [Aeriscardovia sp.]|nr:hypothetical protein [Aeriscardovia sp.]
MMNNVIDIKGYKEENSPHEVAEVICLYCMNRWVSVHRQGEWLAKWKCPKCDKAGGIIYTGQPLEYSG